MNQLVKLALLLHLLMDDMHYIHFNCKGRGFRNIHALAKDYYGKLQDNFDEIVELCMSYGMQVPNPIKAAQLLQYTPLCTDKPFGYKESVALMQQRLCGLVNFLYQLHPGIDDINAKIRIEDLIKEWHKEVNFTLARMISEVCEFQGDTGETLLNRMPDFLFDGFRSLIDSKGIIPGYSLLSKFFPANAKKIIIAFKSKDNFANDKSEDSKSDIDKDLENSLKELDEKVLNEIVEFMSDPSEEALKKLSDDARKYLESLDEEHLKRLQELISDGNDSGSSEGGSDSENSELDEQLKEKLLKLDESVLNEIVEFMSDPSEEALKNLSKEATEFLQGLDEEELNRLQELAAGDGSDEDADNKPSVEETIEKKIAELSEEELEELRFILFDPKGEEGSGKDPELTKKVKNFIDEIGPENYELLKEKASVKSTESVENASVESVPEDPEHPEDAAAKPQQPEPGPQPAPGAGSQYQDLLDRFASLDEDTLIELQSIIKTGRGTGTNVKIERELMSDLSALSEERLAKLTTLVEKTGDGLPHENEKVHQAPVQDPNKAPTNLSPDSVKPDAEQKKMIYQSPENYRLDSAPGGRVSDTRGAQLAMNKVNQEKIQSFSNSNFGNNISRIYADIDRAVGEQLPKDVLDSISQAYAQSGPNGVASVLISRNIMPTKDMISQICSVLADMSPKENFEFSLPYRCYSRMFR